MDNNVKILLKFYNVSSWISKRIKEIIRRIIRYYVYTVKETHKKGTIFYLI